MNAHDDPLARARSRVGEISVQVARTRMSCGVRLLDVRETSEHLAGSPPGAVLLPRSELELRIARDLPDRNEPLMLICAAGGRSLLAASTLLELGFADVVSVAGGTAAWIAAGLPMSAPAMDADWLDRYSRHLRLPGVGVHGQQQLAAARVLVVGAGGLGAPVLLYLAAAGVGTLGIVDDDRVERSNLQRQVIHSDARIGQAKVESAAAAITALNPGVALELHQARLGVDNVDRWVPAYDVIVDGADNLPTRYLLSDACVRHARPLIHAAVHRFDGQVTVFDAGRRRGEAPCYRCLFPHMPGADAAPNCAEAGVLGVLPGVMGLLQAVEVLKLLLDLGDSLSGRLLSFDALSMRFRETRLRPDPQCPVCAPGREFAGYQPFETGCATTLL